MSGESADTNEIDARAATSLRDERAFADSFEADAGTDLVLMEAAAALLLAVLLKATPEPRTVQITFAENDTISGDVHEILLHADVLIGARAWRAIRAGRAVLAAGYESEARAYDRIIVELLAHRAEIDDDPSGKVALEWIDGQRKWGISKKVAALGEPTLYGNLSRDSHGDPVPIQRLIDQESNTVMLSPARTGASGASLLMYASFARDQAVRIAERTGMNLGGLENLDAAIQERWAALNQQDPD